MPTPQQNKRVKGKRITRAFVIGTEAWKLTDANRPPKIKTGDTTGWRVYVRPVPGGPDLTAWLKKVVFVLHETFPNPVRNVENFPFELEESGYGGFWIVVKLYFQPISGEKQQQRQHFLQLDAYGDEGLQAEQAKTGIVRSEIVEHIEFTEPTEALWEALTSETQWDYLNPRSKGKNRGGIPMSLPGPGERTVELPASAPAGSVYSRETEENLLKMINTAGRKTEVETAETLRKTKEINEQQLRAKEGIDVDSKLLSLHDKLPAKK
ncbi:yeats-domain-containing protein [Microthyrium microscopicum]|uniref:Protein AF-9 homolog n=1 Tax=Microthyrium microscopicum TaxID=703497 RepID=A0A6A6UPU2_9PEZI|nr:yeats-domain-containing protein [Microthyrium microscopicum]